MKSHSPIVACLLFLLAISANAQDKPKAEIARNLKKIEKPSDQKADPEQESKADDEKEEFSEILADNSYLVENANNVGPGTLHTLNSCTVSRAPGRDTACGLTQEMSVGGGKHMFSYSASYSFLDSNRVKGIGDLAFTYRHQLTGEEAWAVVSPRFTVFVPTGNVDKGLGAGSPGFQFNLPVTKRVSESFVVNLNAGATVFPKVKGVDGEGRNIKRSLSSYNLGASVVWIAHKNFNPLIEYVENFGSEIGDTGKVVRFNEHIVSPGVGLAWKFGDFKISPGIAVPVSFSRGEVRSGILFYIGFENPFGRRPRIASADKADDPAKPTNQ